MEPTTITPGRLMTSAIVATIALLALVASKNIFVTFKPLNGQGINGVTETEDDANTSSAFNNALYFTSPEAEFEWNQLMAPNYDPGMIDPDRLIEGSRDTGRRLFQGDIVPYGSLRGRRLSD